MTKPPDEAKEAERAGEARLIMRSATFCESESLLQSADVIELLLALRESDVYIRSQFRQQPGELVPCSDPRGFPGLLFGLLSIDRLEAGGTKTEGTKAEGSKLV